MVKLHRQAEPEALREKKADWTQRWSLIRAERAKGAWATDAAKDTLREALLRLAHGKCAFCEGRLGTTTYLEIEHYIAKTVDEDLAFEWQNLLPACRLCNVSKGDTDHQGALLKPDAEDPEKLLWLDYGTGRLTPRMGLSDEECSRVDETVRLCDLNRAELRDMRVRTLTRFRHLLDYVNREDEPDEGLRDDFKSYLAPKQEYKLAVRQALEGCGCTRLAQKDREDFAAAS